MKEMDLVRLIEECGELVQACAKALRFGLNSNYVDGTTNIQQIIAESADVIASIERLGIRDEDLVQGILRKHAKIDFLSKYERGFNSNERYPHNKDR